MNKLRNAPELVFYLSAVALLFGCGGGESSDHGGSVTMPATLGTLVSLQIAPAASSVVACSAVQYVATGNYSDGTILDVTNFVQWGVDPANSAVAIANAGNGQIVGINAGSATVMAWAGSSAATSAVVNVSSGSLTGISITPATSTVAVAGTLAYTASATCNNGGTADISRMNIWTSGNSAVATVSTSGLATAVVAGSSVINATAGAIAASAVLNVQ